MWVLRAKQLWLTTPSATKSPVPVVMSNIATAPPTGEMSTTSVPPSPPTTEPARPRSRLTAGSATARNRRSSRPPPANRSCRTRGPRRCSPGTCSTVKANPSRCSAPAASPTSSSSGVLNRSTPSVVAPTASAMPPRNPAHHSSSGSGGRRVTAPADMSPPAGPADARRRPRPGPSGGPPVARPPTACAADPHEPRCQGDAAACRGWPGGGRGVGGHALRRLGGEEVVRAAERLQLQPLRRERVVDPAVAGLDVPGRVGTHQAVQVALPVGRGRGPGGGQGARAEQDVAPPQPPAPPGPAPPGCHVPPSPPGQEAVLAAGHQRGAVGERDPVAGLRRRPVREHRRGHVAADTRGVDGGAQHDLAGTQVGDRPGATVGEQHPGRPVEAVDAGVAAAPVRVHGPAEGDRRIAGHPVQRRLGLDLVERHPGELGRAYGAQQPAQAGQRQLGADPVVEDLLTTPSHGYIRTHVRTLDKTRLPVRRGRTGCATLPSCPTQQTVPSP